MDSHQVFLGEVFSRHFFLFFSIIYGIFWDVSIWLKALQPRSQSISRYGTVSNAKSAKHFKYAYLEDLRKGSTTPFWQLEGPFLPYFSDALI